MEPIGSAVECLTQTEGPRVRVSPVSLLCVLEEEINPSLVLVQPSKIRPFITERLLMGRKESNQTKYNIVILPAVSLQAP